MKRLFVVLLSGLMLASSVPMNSFASAAATDSKAIAIAAGEDIKNDGITEPTNQGLAEAIKTVKAKITIPEDYSDFNYSFNNTSYYSDASWYLTWSNPKNNSYIQVNCDAENHITYYTQYDYEKQNTGIAKYLKKELKATADAFIKQFVPEVIGDLEYLDADYENIYSGNYVYHYQRTYNGVAFPDNSVTVWVNSVSGKATSISIDWLYDVMIPSKTTSITQEEATKLIKENMKMKLVYRSPYYYIYQKSTDSSNKAFLVYEPSSDYISVDAKTGKVYLDRTAWINTNQTMEASADSSKNSSMDGGLQELTEEEIAKVEELKNMISKEKAIKIVKGNQYLYLDKNLTSYSATLNKVNDGYGNYSYVWNISLNDPREINYDSLDTYRAYASASVDAKTGKILSYYASMNSYYDEKNQKWNSVKISYNKEKAKEILEKFLTSQTKARFLNSVFASESEDYVAYYKNNNPVYGGYSYQYNRVNAGIEFPNNGIYGSVDGVTGKVYSFSTNWDEDIVFESSKGAMSADKAMDYYLSKSGYGLKYEVNVINKNDVKNSKKNTFYDNFVTNNVEYEVRLVYRPDSSTNYISPFTGEPLQNDGTVFTGADSYSYQDIETITNNRIILLLADMNIGFKGEKFLPEKEITVGELNELMEKIGYGSNTTEEGTTNNFITKEEIAQSFIVKLGLEKMSKLSGIYKTGFEDENLISAKYYGAVALAKGLGLIEGDQNNRFNPSKKVTRYEAVELMKNYIKAQQEGVYY